jgi:hypothetical protein
MAWARIDDGFVDHPKILRIWNRCPAAIGLHVRAIAYCSKHLTDGVIPAVAVQSLSPVQSERDEQTTTLVDEGAWYQDERSETFVIHDFLDYQPTREEVADRRKKDRDRKRAGS